MNQNTYFMLKDSLPGIRFIKNAQIQQPHVKLLPSPLYLLLTSHVKTFLNLPLLLIIHVKNKLQGGKTFNFLPLLFYQTSQPRLLNDL